MFRPQLVALYLEAVEPLRDGTWMIEGALRQASEGYTGPLLCLCTMCTMLPRALLSP